jgi:hypothetical protein
MKIILLIQGQIKKYLTGFISQYLCHAAMGIFWACVDTFLCFQSAMPHHSHSIDAITAIKQLVIVLCIICIMSECMCFCVLVSYSFPGSSNLLQSLQVNISDCVVCPVWNVWEYLTMLMYTIVHKALDNGNQNLLSDYKCFMRAEHETYSSFWVVQSLQWWVRICRKWCACWMSLWYQKVHVFVRTYWRLTMNY